RRCAHSVRPRCNAGASGAGMCPPAKARRSCCSGPSTCARPVGPGVSPLDEALGRGGSRYSPRVRSWLARLGANAPCAEAAALLAELTGSRVSAATVRRQTEALGATAVALAEAEVVRIAQAWPVPPVAPDRLVLSVEGAMVPLRHGEWAEMKLLSVGAP